MYPCTLRLAAERQGKKGTDGGEVCGARSGDLERASVDFSSFFILLGVEKRHPQVDLGLQGLRAQGQYLAILRHSQRILPSHAVDQAKVEMRTNVIRVSSDGFLEEFDGSVELPGVERFNAVGDVARTLRDERGGEREL